MAPLFVLLLFGLSALPLTEQLSMIGAHSIFTFSKAQSFLEVKPTWALNESREINFKFRTKRSNGLLVHHGFLESLNPFDQYDLYIKLEKGSVRVIQVYKNSITSMSLGKGLNRDKWHTVKVVIDPQRTKVNVSVDEKSDSSIIAALKELPGGERVESVLFFGGINPNDTIWSRQYGYVPFIGCLGEISLKVNGEPFYNGTLLKSQLELGCIDRCRYNDPCLHYGRCVNHFDKTTCDCFGTKHQGFVCGSDDISTITLRGYSYVSYKIYEWVEKVHSDFTKISINFRTNFDDSVLFYGIGETPIRNYVAASLKDGSVHVTVDFGDKPLSATLGTSLHNNEWHNLTLIHYGKTVRLYLDGKESLSSLMQVTGESHFHLDPRFFIGGVPVKSAKYGLKSVNNFVGSIREAYFGDVSVLERLRYNHTAATYHGLFPPEYGSEDVRVLPVTFFYPESKIRLTTDHKDKLSLSFDFRTTVATCVLAHSGISTDPNEDIGYWELRIEEGAAVMSVIQSMARNETFQYLRMGNDLNDGKWHYVKININMANNRQAELGIDHGWPRNERLLGGPNFSSKIYIGGSTRHAELGFLGCMRQIRLYDKYMDPRIVVDSDQIEGGEISMDNCQLVDPCKQPGVCEHGGVCVMHNNKVGCNCTDTGYTGKTCHFSLYRRTCEELFLIGYRNSAVYMIDIDGNGPHPPAPVYCDIDPIHDVTSTTIETNIPPEMTVRKFNESDFRIQVTYRNFTPEMLQTLIRHSKNCTQRVKFDCYKSPLGLRTYTWFKSSNRGSYVTTLGSKKDGFCPCGDSGTCASPGKYCNCDKADNRWRFDEAALHDPDVLGITEMFFLQPIDAPLDAQGRFTLGPLKCIEMDTQQYVITFKTSDSYLEIPGWKSGDLAFSFRTSHEKAVLFCQPAHFPAHSHFKILLVNAHELNFEFTVRGEPKNIRIATQSTLNSGDWQQVWVDFDIHHVRFTINMDSQMLDLEKGEEFGPFEGPLYVGGAPPQYLNDSHIVEGFVGCLRGLVVNEQVSNLYSYLSPRTPHVVTGCKPSCDPNPCQNGAKCHEFWGTYKCECRNPLAHFGNHCETNINNNGVTFVTENGHFHQLYHDTEGSEIPTVLTEDILANIRTYDSKGLLLYAHDQFNNFVQLHIKGGNQLVFTYNSMRQLVQGSVTYHELSKGISVQILVDREPDRTVLHVNDHKTVIPYPMKLVDKYRQNPWVAGQELELVKPPRPPVEPKPYLQLFLGALDKGNMEANLVGFTGCLNGLRFGSKDFDLASLVDENPGTENFRKYCKMSCNKDPCKNGGYCIEDWKNQQHRCDCDKVSFLGKSCEEDTGGFFDGQSLVKHSFIPDASTYQMVRVKLALSTTKKQKSHAVLLFINSKVDERNFILVAMSPDGQLHIEEDDGSQKVIRTFVKSKSGSFADGRRHWVHYFRQNDNVTLTVDSEPHVPTIITHSKSDTDKVNYGGENSDVVMVGGMEIIDIRFANYSNYTGCLSNVIMEIDTITIYPLETAYGYRPGSLNLQTIGEVKQIRCASLSHNVPFVGPPSANISSKFLGAEWQKIPPAKMPFQSVAVSNVYLEMEIAEANTKRMGLIMGIFLLTILIALVVYLWRVDWKDKQYRYEEGFVDKKPIFKGKKPYRALDNNVRTVSFEKSNNGLSIQDPCEFTSLDRGTPKRSIGWQRQPPPYSSPEATDNSNNEQPTDEEKDMTDVDFATSEPETEPEVAANKKKTSSQELEWEPIANNGDVTESLEALMNGDGEDVEDLDGEARGRDTPEPGSYEASLDNLSENNDAVSESLIPKTPPPAYQEVDDAQKPATSVTRRPRPVGGPRPSPVFLPNNQRAFANPISYLGGPRFSSPPSNRNSVESVLSID